MRRTYRYRLYPTRRQVEALEAHLRFACDLYNAALEQRRDAYRRVRTSVSFKDQIAGLTDLRRGAPELCPPDGMNCWCQQAVLRRLDRAFAAFFRRVKAGEAPGHPRFKSPHRFNTLEFSFAGNAGGIGLTDAGRLRMQGIGHVKLKLHRPIPGGTKLCQARVTRRCGRWYVSIVLDGLAPRPLPVTGHAVGLDLGIATFAATSDGELIAGPRAGREGAKAERRAQRKVSRRKLGSNRRRKAVALLARQREHVRNVRCDHAHKTARALVERYDTICVEALSFRGLVTGRHARDCNDQGWGGFVALLREKAEEAARQIVLVDPWGTSQMCSACGEVTPKTLKTRVHACACGYAADRDVNAARNVLARGLGPDGAVRRERWEKRSVPSPEKPPALAGGVIT